MQKRNGKKAFGNAILQWCKSKIASYAVMVGGYLAEGATDFYTTAERRGTAMKKGICRGHYPLYAHQNSVLMVDTWMCSEILCVACNTRSAIRGSSSPTRIRNYWGPQCKALNFVHNPERSEDLSRTLPLYVYLNHVQVVSTWVCSALPKNWKCFGDPTVVRLTHSSLKRGAFIKSIQQKEDTKMCENVMQWNI